MEKTYFIETKEQYLAIVKSWKAFVNGKNTITSSHLMLYSVLRSKKFDRGFTPVTKAIKLANGCDPWIGRKNAMWGIESAATYGGSRLTAILEPFGETIGPEDIKRAWALIKDDQRLK
jgi:hypothetical protein